MDENKKGFFSVDWRWIVAGYCYLVLFHLLPTYLLGGLSVLMIFLGPFSPTHAGLDPSVVLMVWMLTGIAIVSFIVAFRSKGVTILEPAYAGVLYAVTLAFAFHELLSPSVRSRYTLSVIFWLLIVVILSVTSAWIGEVVQQWRMGRVAAA